MGTDVTAEQFGILVALVGAVSVGYGKILGDTQMNITQAFIDALDIESRFRALFNLAVGVILAVAISLIAVLFLNDWKFTGVGLLAGVIASVNAGKLHDQANEESDN